MISQQDIILGVLNKALNSVAEACIQEFSFESAFILPLSLSERS